MLINKIKRTSNLQDIYAPLDHSEKKENKKKAVEYEGNGDNNYSWCAWKGP